MLFLVHMLLMILTVKKLLKHFMIKSFKKQIKKSNKVIKRNCNKKHVILKRYDIFLIAGLIKKASYKMSEYFPTPKSLGGNVKVELDLYNYATICIIIR